MNNKRNLEVDLNMNEDMTNVYEVDINVTIRTKITLLADNNTELDKTIKEYCDDWMVSGGEKVVNVNVLSADIIGKYNEETDEKTLY